MVSSMAFCCGKNEYWVGTEEISSVPFSLFIRSCNGSNRVFSESLRSGKVKEKPLTDNPSGLEYLLGKFQLILLSDKTNILKLEMFVSMITSIQKYFSLIGEIFHETCITSIMIISWSK